MSTKNSTRLVAAALVCLLFAYAWRLRFLTDDSYITFRYAEKLLDGHGLVFNVGDPVEGYTNFLWTLQIAAIWGLTGIGPETTALALGFASTLGMVAVFIWLARTSPLGSDAAMLLSLMFLSTNRSIAVWTSSGLEQRQLTLFILLAMALTYVARGRIHFYVAASFALALAELTRPETLLYAGCIVAWVALEARINRSTLRDTAKQIGALLGPFLVVVIGHVLFRLYYYGAPLPNTYYAKGKEIWVESGLYYLSGAAIEHAWFLVVPLALLGAIARTRKGDRLHLLSAMLALPHLAYLVRIGGDHFEYRMLDLEFTFLFLAAADGVLLLARRSPVAAGLCAATTLLYANVIPIVHLTSVAGLENSRLYAFHLDLRDEAPAVLWLPGMPTLLKWHAEIRAWEAPRLVASRRIEHHSFQIRQTGRWRAMRELPRHAFPEDLVMMEGAVGVLPFSMKDLTVVDAYGLTDSTIARMPVDVETERRRLAHPNHKGKVLRNYLDSRINISVRPPQGTLEAALAEATYAVQLTPEVWMPFELAGKAQLPDLGLGDEVFTSRPQGSATLVHNGRILQISRRIADFDDKAKGWTRTGAFRSAIVRGGRGDQHHVQGQQGWFINSYDPATGDRATGRMVLDQPIEPAPGEMLAFLVGGGDKDVGVDVEIKGKTTRFTGQRSERLRLVTVPLHGEPARISIVDANSGGWGHVLADSFLLVRDDGPAPP